MLLNPLGQPNLELDTGAEHGHTASKLTGSLEGLGTSGTAAEPSYIDAQKEHLQKRLAGHCCLQDNNRVCFIHENAI